MFLDRYPSKKLNVKCFISTFVGFLIRITDNNLKDLFDLIIFLFTKPITYASIKNIFYSIFWHITHKKKIRIFFSIYFYLFRFFCPCYELWPLYKEKLRRYVEHIKINLINNIRKYNNLYIYIYI